MRYKDPVTGEWKTISIKAADTLPIGTEVDYDGDTVPDGWERIIEPGSFIVFGLDEAFTWNVTNEWGNFPFNMVQRYGGDDFIKYNSSIATYKVIADIKKIRISAKISFMTAANMYWLMLQLYKNDIGISKSISGVPNTSNSWYELSLTTTLEVKKGDILKLAVLKDTDGNINFNPLNNVEAWGSGNACEILFEVIE